MRKSPCCPKVGLKRGPWSAVEDAILTSYIQQHGIGRWRSIPEKAGLLRCGKSCRLRWMNYLQPGIKRGNMNEAEIDLIVRLHRLLGNRWSLIAGRIPGRTDNEIKNYWNTHLQKKTLPAPPSAKNKKAINKSSPECNNNKNKDNEAKMKIYVPKPIRICAPANATVCKKVETPAKPSVEVEDGNFLGLGWEMPPESVPVTGDEVMLEKVFDEYLQLLY